MTTTLASCVEVTRLTGAQRAALALVADPGLHRVSGGYAARGRRGRVQMQTIDILIDRCLIEVSKSGGLIITRSGRALLADLEGRS